jgi:hypothetical protein
MRPPRPTTSASASRNWRTPDQITNAQIRSTESALASSARSSEPMFGWPSALISRSLSLSGVAGNGGSGKGSPSGERPLIPVSSRGGSSNCASRASSSTKVSRISLIRPACSSAVSRSSRSPRICSIACRARRSGPSAGSRGCSARRSDSSVASRRSSARVIKWSRGPGTLGSMERQPMGTRADLGDGPRRHQTGGHQRAAQCEGGWAATLTTKLRGRRQLAGRRPRQGDAAAMSATSSCSVHLRTRRSDRARRRDRGASEATRETNSGDRVRGEGGRGTLDPVQGA